MTYRATVTIYRGAEKIANPVFIGTNDDFFNSTIAEYASNIIMKDIPDWILTQPMKDFILDAFWDTLTLWEEDFWDGYEVEYDPVLGLTISVQINEM